MHIQLPRLRDIEIFFRPFHYRKLNLATRLVMAPMTRSFAPGGIPTLDMAAYYLRRALHEIGLIITEGAIIGDPSASADANCPHFYGGSALRAWKLICRAVHTTPCRIAPQLWHVGMARPWRGNIPHPEAAPIGPSGIDPVTLQRTATPMTRSRIAAVIDAYAEAAGAARKLGFDAVEIHGAHGYLIDQFLWGATNHRQDEYGGDLVGRTRFAREVVQAVRKSVGSRFPIIFRLSQWKVGHYDARLAQDPHELGALLAPLCDAGVDIFHCSTRRFDRPEFTGSSLSLAGWVKRLTGRPTIAVGSVGLDKEFNAQSLAASAAPEQSSLPQLTRMLGAGEFDLIAIGRALIADPAWASKIHLAAHEAIRPYSKDCLRTLW